VECKEPVEVRVMTVARELAKYKLVQGIIFFVYGKGSKNHQIGTGFFVTTVVAIKKVNFISDRMAFI
jgi:hypothetical protein